MYRKRPVQKYVTFFLGQIIWGLLLWGVGPALAAGVLEVQCRAGLLTLTVQEQPLKAVLAAVEQECGVQMTYLGPVTMPGISATVASAPLAEGLKHLLALAKVQNYTLISQTPSHGESPGVSRILFLTASDASRPPQGTAQGATSSSDGKQSHSMVRLSQAEMAGLLAQPLSVEADLTLVTLETPPTAGLQVQSVGRGSLFEKIGIQSGDVVFNVNGMEVKNTEVLERALQQGQETPGRPFRLMIARDGKVIVSYLMPETAPQR